jgi:chromosome segregation ATPase
MLSVDMQNLETQFAAVKQELAVRVHELEESVFKNSEEKLALLKKQELLQSTLSKVEGQRDDLQKSCEVIQHDMNRLAEKMEQQETQLTDRISELVNENSEMEGLKHKLEMQQVELSEFETKLARANLEIDDQEKQLAAVHSILLENSKEQTLLQKNIEQLEAEKVRGPCRMLII